jgi:hypothetical protein
LEKGQQITDLKVNENCVTTTKQLVQEAKYPNGGKLVKKSIKTHGRLSHDISLSAVMQRHKTNLLEIT